MNKRAVLRFDGNLEQGFRVAVEIGEEGHLPFTEAIGHLPPASELVQCLNQWQTSYRKLSGNTRISLQKITIQMGAVAQNQICRQLAKELQQHFKAWLESSTFQVIGKRLREAITSDDSVRVLVHTQDDRLHFLPWQFWDFVDQYSNAEIAFCASAFKRNVVGERATDGKVRVLAILGDSSGVDIEADRQFLESLPSTAVTFLSEPSRQQINQQLWEQSWDILFFAGHSRTEENQGRIFINAEDSLTIEELRYGLKQAVAKGLQLAIFNSCDGLGLAYELDQLHLPQLIVMREPIPDRVAQEFLRYFLTAYVSENSLYRSERQARERLQGLEREFPCASWLPVVFQNPAEIPPTWQDLLNGLNTQSKEQETDKVVPPTRPKQGKKKRFARFWQGFLVLVAISLFVTSVVMEARSRGMLLAWELPAYDQMLRWQPEKEPDKRLLIVSIDDADIAYQQQQGWKRRWSLSDEALNLLLEKLKQYEPRAIGLDIIRDAPVDSSQTELATRLRTTDNLYVICKVQGPEARRSGTLPPPEVLDETRKGFNNVLPDFDGVVRRQILSMGTPPPKSPCTARYALSTLLAFRYLAPEGIEPTFTPDGNLQLGKREVIPYRLRPSTIGYLNSVIFNRLRPPAIGYLNSDLAGNQILLNYRTYNGSPFDFADTVTLTDVLTDRVQSKLLKDRVILIGVITSTDTANDFFATPLSKYQPSYEKIPGVVLHAQMVSQILSAALGERTLITVLPHWKGVLWVWVWSALSGIIILGVQSRLRLIVAESATVCMLYILCYYSFSHSYWLPLIPAGLAIILVNASLLLYLKTRHPVQ